METHQQQIETLQRWLCLLEEQGNLKLCRLCEGVADDDHFSPCLSCGEMVCCGLKGNCVQSTMYCKTENCQSRICWKCCYIHRGIRKKLLPRFKCEKCKNKK